MTDLIALAERCEQAAGPTFALDTDIAYAIKAPLAGIARPYTASLDAAMTLVPEGMMAAAVKFSDGTGRGNIHDGRNVGGNGIDVRAVTPALALCATALRARAEIARLQESENGSA